MENLPEITDIYKTPTTTETSNPTIKKDTPVLNDDLNDNKVSVDQDVNTKGNRTHILFCSCFNWLD